MASKPVGDLRIILLGKNVSENSRAGNFILGRSVFDTEAPPGGVDQCCEKVRGKLEDKHITVINNTHLLHLNLSDDQIRRGVSECVSLSAPGPHVIILILQHHDFSEKDRIRVNYVLEKFNEEANKRTIVLTDEERDGDDQIHQLIQECGGGHLHFDERKPGWHSEILQKIQKILEDEEDTFLVSDLYEDVEETSGHLVKADEEGENSDCNKDEILVSRRPSGDRPNMSERINTLPSLNVVLCGSDSKLKAFISDLFLKQNERGSETEDQEISSSVCLRFEACGQLINLLELPALFNTQLSDEERIRQALHYVSLCDPGVHVFLLIIPDGPLTDEDKAETEAIQKIFSSRINKHTIVLIMQKSEHNTAELNETMKSFIESFGGKHEFVHLITQVPMMVEKLVHMMAENNRSYFSTETFWDVQLEKLVKYEEMQMKPIHTKIQPQDAKESSDDVRIVLLGKTGVGKSATGNTILGRKAFKADVSGGSVTKECQRETAKVNSRSITVIDTPGLFDTQLSNEEIQREISNCISMILPGPHVFIIVLSLAQRFTKEEAGAVKIIQEMFGENSITYTMVLFTREDELKDKTIEDYLRNPKSAVKNLIEQCRNRYHVFNNTETEDQTQVSALLEKIDDMVKANGDSYYSSKIFREMEREKQEEQIKAVMEKNEELSREKEEEIERMKMNMEEERQNHEQEKKKTEEEFIKRKDTYEREMKEQEKEMRDEMRKEQETFRNEIVGLKKEIKDLQIKNDKQTEKLMNNQQQNRELFEEDRGKDIESIKTSLLLREPKINKQLEKLFSRLNLTNIRHSDQIRTEEILQISKFSLQSQEPQKETELVNSFLQKLMNMNYRARDNLMKDREDDSEIHCEIHMMDVQMAVFHCADSFLKQLMITKLSQCQFALPLLVPDPFTQQIEFPLWTFRQINKSWKMKNTDNEIISKVQPVCKAETAMVSFFRFGSLSSSKSELMNNLINEKHKTFFHRNCSGSSKSRLLMDGVVEITWYCPSGKDTDTFTDCVAFCNLHGDAGDNMKQYEILTSISSVNVLFLPDFGQKNHYKGLVRTLFRSPQPLICLLTDNECPKTKLTDGKFMIGLLNKNQSDLYKQIRETIKQCLKEHKKTFKLEDVAKHTGVQVDENNPECQRGKEAALEMMTLLDKEEPSTVKETYLPCQGKPWNDWCKMNKELYHLSGENLEEDKSNKLKIMREIREKQVEQGTSDFIKIFMDEMLSLKVNEKKYFLKWIVNLLDDLTKSKLCELYKEYIVKWDEVLNLKMMPEKLQIEQTNIEKISEQINKTAFGLEHILREVGQIYESKSSVKRNNLSDLPSLAAEMMISGFPLELMDGDAAHVPLIWVTAVLDKLIQTLGDQRVFVLSVLGIQSSGKSTMLNAMFGLEFAVNAGRCTRGAFMQLIRVSEEMKDQMKFDYILVVDTEGLRAPELSGRSIRNHDNELATFVVGLGHLTLINIFGENPSEMQDILQIVIQAFLRMKEVKLNPSCMFVHQNVSEVTAGEKNMVGRRRLLQTLDEMTKLAAKYEVCDAEHFSDVITFDVKNDVKYFAQLWEGNPPMAPLNPNYCENVLELKETIIRHASKSDGMMLTQLKERIGDLWTALLNEQFVFSFKNSMEIAIYRKIEREYNKWSWSLRRTMLEIENKLHNRIGNNVVNNVEEADLYRELEVKSEEVKKTMSEFFEKDRDAGIMIQWKGSFEIKIKELQENIVMKTKKKLNQVLQQRDLKKKIDAQRTQHENSLFEKSKKLALKLKDKANDENIMEKEFDSFWKEQVDEIIRDTPAVKNIYIINDMKEHLLNNYKSLPVDLLKTSRANIDMLSLPSYLNYVQKKKSNWLKATMKKALTSLGFNFSTEHEVQISTLIKDIAEQADEMIQSYNIAKMGYNISCIQQLIDYINTRLTDHDEDPKVKYVFKREFFMDLVLCICERAKKTITDQHKRFTEANDPVKYFNMKRDEYYRIFQKYFQGATSAAITAEFICNKLKKTIEQNVYKNTAREIADEIKSNCESLNGNRSNLEKHILKMLANKEDFDAYMSYIKSPKEHFKDFIRGEVRQYITERFQDSVKPKMKSDITQLQNKIINAAHETTKHVKDTKGNVHSWLTYFIQLLSDVLVFSVSDLSGVNVSDVDINILGDVIKEETSSVISDICSRFTTETFPEMLETSDRPDEILINHFCMCCWVQCPFCAAICTNTIENHDQDHSVPFHRNNGLHGWHYSETTNLSISICTSAVASDQSFYADSDVKCLWKEYRKGGPKYAHWRITPDLSELPYWKWFVCKFQKNLEEFYKKTYNGNGRIPDKWRKFSQEDAIESLDKYM